jgi:hypothetical protein
MSEQTTVGPPKLSRIRAKVGRKGGQSTSAAKAAAARLNGLKGGKPHHIRGKKEVKS